MDEKKTSMVNNSKRKKLNLFSTLFYKEKQSWYKFMLTQITAQSSLLNPDAVSR